MATVNLRDPLGTGKMVRDAWSLKSGPDNSAASTLPSVMTPQTTTRAPAEVQTPTIPVEQVSQPTAPVPAIDPGRTKSNLTPTIEGIKAGAASLVSAFDDYKNSPQRFRDEMIAVGNEDLAPQKDHVRVDAQLAQKEERARQLSNRIIERDRAYQEQLEALEQNPEGKLRGALNADINDLNRERSRELADLSFAYQVANGDFQAAQQVVDARIADIEADREARMNMWTQAYEFAQDDMTESEKLEAEQAFQLQMTEMEQSNRKEMVRYELELKQQFAPPSSSGFSAPTVKTINGVDMQWNTQTGQWEEILGGSLSNTLSIIRAEDDINTVDALITDPGLNKAVGPNPFARWTPFRADVMTGDTKNFIAEVDALTKNLTLDKLIDAKAEGATFGALAIEEMRLLEASASKINTWREVDDTGATKFYDASESDFKSELDEINKYRKIDAIRKGVPPQNIGVVVTSDGRYFTRTSDGMIEELPI